ncbi:deoxyribodipyrimidine photo-lyase [Dyadobacter sp. CY323]|uniref:deoxyribodipyrimidine photo-lyase n=1 Tax=Dyadobacter sp. CY323 TaxID=2907302 RepID=UPI001F1B4C2B|nr:deoxyribodipyrimidine photo-lyase [Dyadobacter sp. CY323]MCE6988434.1 deoxyribodipyrimidine photo-lyase [Dyadobacter sp. CY323]
MAQRIIYWFRNDLRLNDNDALLAAVNSSEEIVPVYVFDPRQFENTKLKFRRTGALRAKFLIESVAELRNRLRQKGGELLIRIGEPEKIVAQIAEDYSAQYVYTSKEIGPEETRIESSLSKNLKIFNVDIKLFWMDTLVHAMDLPFPISKLPASYNDFDPQIRKNLTVKEVSAEPLKITLPSEYEAGAIPSLPALGIDPIEISKSDQTNLHPAGGESAALSALTDYLGQLNNAYSESEPLTDSRLSDWLSLGCLSARFIYHEALKSRNGEFQNLIDDLLKRDYFQWILLRYGPRIFKLSGVKHDFSTQWAKDQTVFDSWAHGETTDIELNKCMKMLKANGFITARERQFAADYLVNNLRTNWTWGAMFFESCLLDYEVSVNWGKWNNIAGVGHD